MEGNIPFHLIYFVIYKSVYILIISQGQITHYKDFAMTSSKSLRTISPSKQMNEVSSPSVSTSSGRVSLYCKSGIVRIKSLQVLKIYTRA